MKKNQRGNVMAILLVVLVAAFVVWVGIYIKDHHKTNDLSPAAGSSQGSNSSTTLSGGSDDQSLNSDLQNINSGLTQGSQNLQSTNSSLNDQQLPVTE